MRTPKTRLEVYGGAKCWFIGLCFNGCWAGNLRNKRGRSWWPTKAEAKAQADRFARTRFRNISVVVEDS